jgi:hypothetical protein
MDTFAVREKLDFYLGYGYYFDSYHYAYHMLTGNVYGFAHGALPETQVL